MIIPQISSLCSNLAMPLQNSHSPTISISQGAMGSIPLWGIFIMISKKRLLALPKAISSTLSVAKLLCLCCFFTRWRLWFFSLLRLCLLFFNLLTLIRSYKFRTVAKHLLSLFLHEDKSPFVQMGHFYRELSKFRRTFSVELWECSHAPSQLMAKSSWLVGQAIIGLLLSLQLTKNNCNVDYWEACEWTNSGWGTDIRSFLTANQSSTVLFSSNTFSLFSFALFCSILFY